MTRLVCFAILLAAVCPVVSSAEEETATVKVMSFNVRYGTARDGDNAWDNRKELVAKTIRAFDADLLGTQETLGFQRDYVLEKCPGYESLAVGREDGADRGEMTPVFWKKDRFEKLDGGHFWLSEQPNVPGSVSWDSSLTRMASWVKLRDRKLPDAPTIVFLNTHFDHRGREARFQSAALIRKWIGEHGEDCRLVVTGDFNAAEASQPYLALFGEVQEKASPVVDTFRVANRERGENEGTFNGFKPEATDGGRIDWIAVSRDWTIQSAKIDRTASDGRTPSDHFPVTATLQFSPAE
jgi:endonuclease/exonuclease/phosphatase family metal-dependent hydrolase